MISEIFRHWRYFIPKLTVYGLQIGAIFGALTYPIFGAFVGAPWGLAGGSLLGILMGIGVPIYNRYFAPEDSQEYQTQITFGTGMLTIIVMAIPLLFIYALPAGIVAAYVAHQYAEIPNITNEKRKHSLDKSQRRENVYSQAVQCFMSTGHYVVGLGILMAILAYSMLSFLDPFTFFEWIAIPLISVGGAIYGFIVAAMIAMANAQFVMMANRLFFDVDMPKSQYKPRIIASVAVLTLFISMIVTAGIGAPIAAIAGAFGAAKYADWYYEPDEEEKAKRSAENLQDNEMVEDDFMDEEVERGKFSRST